MRREGPGLSDFRSIDRACVRNFFWPYNRAGHPISIPAILDHADCGFRPPLAINSSAANAFFFRRAKLPSGKAISIRAALSSFLPLVFSLVLSLQSLFSLDFYLYISISDLQAAPIADFDTRANIICRPTMLLSPADSGARLPGRAAWPHSLRPPTTGQAGPGKQLPRLARASPGKQSVYVSSTALLSALLSLWHNLTAAGGCLFRAAKNSTGSARALRALLRSLLPRLPALQFRAFIFTCRIASSRCKGRPSTWTVLIPKEARGT